MYKKLRVICPREENKRYFSWAHQRYQNDLTVRVNDVTLFEKINDCEENLPITMEKSISWSDQSNHVQFDYDIHLGENVQESACITLDFHNDQGTLTIFRPAPVLGAETIRFQAMFAMNDQQFLFGDEYHQGDQKLISRPFILDPAKPFTARWTCSKVSRQGGTGYYDDLIMELE
jgi:hypothetical protein